MNEFSVYKKQIYEIINELYDKAELKKGDTLVVGCSTSEILGGRIGKNSSEELGVVVAETVIDVCNKLEIYPAFQCCEHLNRAIVCSTDLSNKLNLARVNVKPQLHAGGGVATAAYNRIKNVCMVMNIQADAVIDIGDTIVGMHIKPVAVPVRPTDVNKKIGNANVVMAYSRLPYIGGPRAIYQ